jgi:hypothetical protein
VFFVRYGIAAILCVAGFVALFVIDDTGVKIEIWAMCVGGGLSVLLLNWLFRYGNRGDDERDEEQAARDFHQAHGHWPDEPPA